MTTGTTRSILVGALAASLLFAAPVVASAAVPAHVSFALYEGVDIPSTKAELTRFASIKDSVPVYSEPAGSGKTLTHLLPKVRATGESEDRIKVSASFTADGEKWFAIQVPEAAHGTDDASSDFAEAGVGYVRAGTVTVHDVAAGPAPTSFPSTKDDLVTKVEVVSGVALFRQPIESREHALDKGTPIRGIVLKSSPVFEYNERRWLAVEVDGSVVTGGIAYILADDKFMVLPTAGATASAAPTAGQVQAGTAAPTAPAAAVPTAPAAPEVAPRLAGPEPDAFTKFLGNVPATIFAALVMAGTLFILRRRTA